MDKPTATDRLTNTQPEMQELPEATKRRTAAILGAASGLGKFAMAGAAAVALRGQTLGDFREIENRQMAALSGGPDKSAPPPTELDHTSPLAKYIRIRFDGEVRPDDVLSYNVVEGWIVCGRYTTINGQRAWRRERGRILSYTKTGVVEPFWR